MKASKKLAKRQTRRRFRVRNSVRKSANGRPRLSIFRSNKHIYAQIIDDVQGVKDALAMDSFIHSCWVSPSGNGVKALVRITNPERHKDHYRALERYFTDVYSLVLDPTGVNVSRACYESYDPDIIIKDDCIGCNIRSSVEQHIPKHNFFICSIIRER